MSAFKAFVFLICFYSTLFLIFISFHGLIIEDSGLRKIGFLGEEEIHPQEFSSGNRMVNSKLHKLHAYEKRLQSILKYFIPLKATQSDRLEYQMPTAKQVLGDEMLRNWKNSEASYCNGSFVAYAYEFARLRRVILDPSKIFCERHGGERIQQVLNQTEEAEMMKFSSGFFSIHCHLENAPVKYNFIRKNHLNDYIAALKIDGEKVEMETISSQHQSIIKGLQYSQVWERTVFAITRYEYVNLFHTMTDWFNAFLMMVIFQIPPDEIDIIFFDAHPVGNLDGVWTTLWTPYYRIGNRTTFHGPIIFRDLVWVMQGYNSPIDTFHLDRIPFIEEFRKFFLIRHGLPVEINGSSEAPCNNLKVLFIWRRDYVAHPRNPSGHVNRKISNEQELLDTLLSRYGNFNISGLQLDLLSMRDQLDLVVRTDILVGMHGAGLSHSLFLPTHGGLIEFYPTYWGSSNVHFMKFAQWRKLHYVQWVNEDAGLEINEESGIIPPDVLLSLMQKMLHMMGCVDY